MKNRKWQRVLSWILTLTMLFGTFEGTGFRAFAAEDEVAAEETADDEATAAEEEADSEDTDVNDDAEASDEEEADDEAEAEVPADETEDDAEAEEEAVAEDEAEAEEAVEAEEEEAVVEETEADTPEEEEIVTPDEELDDHYLMLKEQAAQNQQAAGQRYVTGGAVTMALPNPVLDVPNSAAVASQGTIGDIEFKYGMTYNDFSFAARDFSKVVRGIGGAEDYTGVSWTLYTLKELTEDDTFDGEVATYTEAWNAYMPKAFDKDELGDEYDNLKKAVTDHLDLTATNNDILPKGISMSVANGVLTIGKTEGIDAPIETGTFYYVLELKDAAAPEDNAVIYTNVFKITVLGADINAPEIQGTNHDFINNVPKNTANACDDNGEFELGDAPVFAQGDGYEFLGGLTFDAGKVQGYVVSPTKPKDTLDEKWVAPLGVTLSATTPINGLTAVTDLSYKFVDADGKEITDVFVVSANNTKMRDGSPVEISIAPRTGLQADSSDNNGIFVAYLCIDSAMAFEKTKVVKITFVVGSDVELKVRKDKKLIVDDVPELVYEENTVYTEAEIIAPAAHGIVYYDDNDDNDVTTFDSLTNEEFTALFTEVQGGWRAVDDIYVMKGLTPWWPVDLGTFEVGKTITGIEFTAEGTGNSLRVTMGEDIDESKNPANAGFAYGAANLVTATVLDNAGLDLVYVEGSNESKMNLTGAFKLRGDKTMDPVIFGISGMDEGNNSNVKYYRATPTYLGVTISVNGVKQTTGSLANEYKWVLPSDGDLDDGAVPVTIWNPSDSDVTLEIDGVLADLEGGNQKGKMIITVPTVKNSRYVVTIAAQSEGTFVVTPTMVEGEDEADKYATGKITLTGLAVEETAITLRMTQSKDNARFVVPAMGVSDIGSAEVGKEFSYQFELAKDKNVAPNVTWEIVANAVQGDDTLIDGNMAEGELTAEDLATYYGISIDENTGLLSAAPVVRLSEEGDVLNAYNMYTYTNEKEIANRVVGAGKLLPLDHKYTFWVKATYYVGDNATPNYIYKKIELTIAKPTSALELGNGVVTMNDYDNPENNKLDMGSIGLDSGTGKSEVVNVKNVTNVDVNNVKVEIVGVKRYEEGRLKEVVDDWSEMFTIVYDDNATLQANGVKFGLNVNAKGSTPFTIKSLPSTGAAGQLKAGEYEVQIRLHNVADNVAGHEAIMDFNMNKLGSASFFGNDDLNDTNDVKNGFFFTATLNVVDAPIIEARKNTIATEENVDRIKVGYKLAATGTESVANGFLVNRGFTARLANDTDTQFDLTMTDAPGSTTKIAESGIWMDKDGAFTTSGNKVLKAGVYNIVITAVSRTDGDNGQTRGEREFTLVIYGDDKAAFQVKAVNDQTVLTADHTWMLPGQIAGGASVKQQFQVEMTAAGAAVDGKNVKVTITDAEDDRIAKDISANPANPYIGSSEYFTTEGVKDDTLYASELNSFIIKETGTPAAGKYKVKVTITGDNLTTQYFYVCLVVTDPLAIDQILDAQAMVGDKYRREITARGAADDQSVTWIEVDPAEEKDDLEKTDITNNDDKSVIKKTGLALLGGAARTIAPEMMNDVPQTLTGHSTYLGASITTAEGTTDLSRGKMDAGEWIQGYGVPTAQGKYTITVLAKVAAQNYYAEVGEVVANTDGIGRVYLNKDNIYPAQAATMTFDLNVSKSDKISKTTLYNKGVVGVDADRDNVNIIGNNYEIVGGKAYDRGIVGTLTNSDSQFADYTGYVLKSDTVAYTNDRSYATGAVTYTIDSLSLAPMDLTVELENGADSDFDILLVRTTNAYNVEGDENFVRVGAAAMASKKGVVTIPANGDDDTPTKAYITIVPKEGLAAREEAYTDTIKISGENMLNEIELGISFTVEDAIYQTDAYYWNWAHVGDDGARTDLVIADVPVENAIVELATVVVSAVGSAAEARYLTEEGDRSMMNYVTIKNSGNSPINYLSVEECTENGGTISNSASLLQANGVKKIDLYTFTMQGGEVIAADAQGKPGLERDDTVYFKVVPKKIDSTGIFTAYVKVSFKEKGSDNVHSYVIPVTYWVTDVNRDADSKAKVEPADATVVIEAKEEGYENGSAFRTYAVRNLNDVEDKNAFAHLSVELNNGANFTLSSETADVNGDARLVFDHVPAGGSVEFKVTAKTGLSKLDSYQDTVKVNAYNFQNPKTSNVKFKVEASSKYTVELLDARGTGKNADRYFPENAVLPDIMDYVPVTATTIAPGFTERLYNSFVKGAAAKNNAKIIGVLKNGAQEVQVIDGVSVYVPNGAEVVALDLDGNEKIDTAIMFTMDNGVPAANTPAYAYKCGGAKFELDDVVFALTDEEIAQITRYDQQNHTTTEYFSTIEFKLSTVVYFELADGEVFTEDVLTLKDNANVTLDGYDGVTIASIRGVEIIVPYGKTIASVTGGYMPKAEKAEEAFESWVNDGHYDDVIAVKVDTKINQPHILTPHWHQHQWPGSAVSANQFVKWSWTEDGEGGYKDPVVTIYCTDENCPAADKGERSFSGATTPRVEFDRKDAVPATCLVGASVQYHAKVTYGTNTYEDTIVVDDGKPNGHNYAGTVIWEQEVVSKGIFTNPDKDREIVWHASVSLNCTQCDATTEGHSLTVSGDEVTVSVNIVKEPTCDDVGVKRYTVVSCNVPAGSKFAEFVLTNEAAHELTKESNIPANGHQINFTAESVEHVDDFKTDPEHPTSQVKITCPVCEKVVFEGKVNLVQDPNNKSRWTSNITFENGEVYIFETFDHTEHEWDLVWSWEGTTSQNAVAKAIFTCKIGEEQVVIDGNPVGVVSGNITTYTATVVGPDGETYTDTKAFDENGNEITHEHVWRFDGFDWSKCTSKGGKVTVTYTCTAEKGGEVFTDTIDAKLVKETKTVATYEVSYVGPDGVTKTEKKSYNKETGGEAGGDIEVGNGIFVSGLEEEYTFTGKAIKPAITVWDNDRGVQLAIGTDCTVSYKNNTKLTAGNNKGPAQILIKGKGNYAGKKAYVTFNIVDLDADIDRSEFVEVKKVAVSKDNFTYTGEALYPKTITVTYGNKQTIVLTRGDDPTVADYSGEGSDKVELVFQNNVNKGTANVAVYGSAAKPKAANYAIKAASISGVTGANELGGITWAVKAETPEANLSLGDYDLVLGQDYTMKVTAKTVGTATVKINGKGNFSGKLDASCEVTALELGEENIIVNAFSGKKVKVTVVDNAGNKVAGKFYSFTYAWEGNDLTVTVSATAKANGAIVFTDGEKTVNVGATKLPKMKKSSDYIFNGEALVFDSQEDLAKYVDTKGLELDKDFVIASYQNNNKKGTMKITIQGTGTYGGTQVVSVKIAPKEINNTKAQ